MRNLRNVRLWIWAYWTNVDRQKEVAFAQFEKWGIAGAKIDFMDRADQWMVNWYRDIARSAASHHLLIDYHGAFKPDGLRRTCPNVLTREGVMGAEYNKWSTRETPTHNVTLAFTRMLAGPMDYTPGGFDNVTREAFQMVSDHPAAYEGQKELEFLKAVPTSWDETRALNGRPAQFITLWPGGIAKSGFWAASPIGIPAKGIWI